MDGMTLYEIEFRYCDNGQLYQLPVLLTASEHKQVSQFLQGLLEAGEIEAADGTDSDTIDNVLYEPAVRQPIPFAELRKRWEGGTLMRMADENGIKL